MPVEAKHSHWLYREAKNKEMAVSTIERRLCFFYGAILHPRKKKLVFGVGTKNALPITMVCGLSNISTTQQHLIP